MYVQRLRQFICPIPLQIYKNLSRSLLFFLQGKLTHYFAACSDHIRLSFRLVSAFVTEGERTEKLPLPPPFACTRLAFTEGAHVARMRGPKSVRVLSILAAKRASSWQRRRRHDIDALGEKNQKACLFPSVRYTAQLVRKVAALICALRVLCIPPTPST